MRQSTAAAFVRPPCGVRAVSGRDVALPPVRCGGPRYVSVRSGGFGRVGTVRGFNCVGTVRWVVSCVGTARQIECVSVRCSVTRFL